MKKQVLKVFIYNRSLTIKQGLSLKNLYWHNTVKVFKQTRKYYFLDKSSNRSYYSKYGLSRFKLKKYHSLGFLPLRKK